MKLEHRFTVPASPADAWSILTDLKAVAECFPGARITSVSGGTYQGEVGFRLGAIGLTFDGSAEFLERDSEGHRAVILAKGKDKRGSGDANATVTLELQDAGGGSTNVSLQTDLEISGKPAQFGRGLLQEVSERLLKQFVRCIEKKFAAPEQDAVSGAAPAAPPSGRARTDEQVSSFLPTAAAGAVPRISSAGLLIRPSDVTHVASFGLGFLVGVAVILRRSRR